jgi:hypothetical protein
MERAARTDLLRRRRTRHEPVVVGGAEILVRDQAPLHKGNLQLLDGYSFEDFVESLNRRIFFWPGGPGGPISYGVRHFERYREESPVILRISFQSLLKANPSASPQYCKYNSGSPRCSDGNKSPRGPNTFLSIHDFSGTPSQVVEVTFDREIQLPKDSEFGANPKGPWRPLL